MGIKTSEVVVGGYYAAGRQIRKVTEIKVRTVERVDRKTRETISKRIKQVRYQSRGHNAAMKFGNLVWVGITKFAADVDKKVVAHYDPDYP